MNKNKKITLIIGIALVSIVLLIGVTYALNYTQTGTNQELVLGDIYMHYNEISGLSITDAVPGSDYSNYFEFKISGKNTYTKKDIYYDFILNKGDVPNGKMETDRIPDEYLKFKLVSVDSNNQETVLLENKKYSSLENKRIYVETIEKNTTTEVNRTYRLYMTIDESLLIGNTSDALFTFSEFEKAFGSIKVSVTGDFNEKELELEPTDEACFETYATSFYTRNKNMTEEELTACANFFMDGNLYGAFTDLEVARNFCNGTGKIAMCSDNYCQASFEDMLARGGYLDPVKEFTTEDFDYFVNNNIVEKELGVIITDYDESCGNDVVIPNKINNSNVLRLNGFYYKKITSVVIPNGVRAIESDAFAYNYLQKVVIPSSIIYINYNAFSENLISDLTIESGVEIIGSGAFSGNQLTSVTFPSSIRSCYYSAFDDGVIINNSSLTCDSEDPLYSPFNS